jgi:hypothetical protein
MVLFICFLWNSFSILEWHVRRLIPFSWLVFRSSIFVFLRLAIIWMLIITSSWIFKILFFEFLVTFIEFEICRSQILNHFMKIWVIIRKRLDFIILTLVNSLDFPLASFLKENDSWSMRLDLLLILVFDLGELTIQKNVYFFNFRVLFT